MKFNPTNNSRLVTCGVKHIKFWTLSGNTLAGKSGVMGTVAPLQTFLTLSFDRYANVLAGTLNGMVYQFEENKLVKAHQLHKVRRTRLLVSGQSAECPDCPLIGLELFLVN